MSGVSLCVRLVFGFAVVLAPGASSPGRSACARAVGALAWALAIVFAALAVTFLVSASLT